MGLKGRRGEIGIVHQGYVREQVLACCKVELPDTFSKRYSSRLYRYIQIWHSSGTSLPLAVESRTPGDGWLQLRLPN